MDITEENMTLKGTLEKIAELEYSQNQLRNLNTEMRQWLDVADDDMAALRSENATLRKQVKVLERTFDTAQQIEAEPCGRPLADDPDVKKCSEKEIQRLEEESTMMKEQNKKLTAELKSLQQERERDRTNLSKFMVAIQTLEKGMEEAQLELQDRDEVIHQKDLCLKHLEETVEEGSNFIKELRLMNQALRKQLEERQDEASLFAITDPTGEKDGLPHPPLSFAEEIGLLASSAKGKTNMSDSKHLKHRETDAEEQQKPEGFTMDLQTKRRDRNFWCAGILETVIHKVGLFVLCVFIFTVLAFVASGSYARNYDLFSIHNLWKGARLMLQPYCSIHYGALPPV